jgi:hypothetical protein
MNAIIRCPSEVPTELTSWESAVDFSLSVAANESARESACMWKCVPHPVEMAGCNLKRTGSLNKVASDFTSGSSPTQRIILACDHLDSDLLDVLAAQELIIVTAEPSARETLAALATPDTRVLHVEASLVSQLGGGKLQQYEPRWLNAVSPLVSDIDSILPDYSSLGACELDELDLSDLAPLCQVESVTLVVDKVGDLRRLLDGLLRLLKTCGRRLRLLLRVPTRAFHSHAILAQELMELIEALGMSAVLHKEPASEFGEWVQLELLEECTGQDEGLPDAAALQPGEIFRSQTVDGFRAWRDASESPSSPQAAQEDGRDERLVEMEQEMEVCRALEAKVRSDLEGLQRECALRATRINLLEEVLDDILDRAKVAPKSASKPATRRSKGAPPREA